MKRLILVRHGNFHETRTGDQPLTDFGIRKITEVGKYLQTHLNGYCTCLVTSQAPRARHSARIIGGIIRVAPEDDRRLWLDSTDRSLSKVLELVRSKKDDFNAIVLVTHAEITNHFSYYFGKHELGVESFDDQFIPQGEAVEIDCERRTCLRVP